MTDEHIQSDESLMRQIARGRQAALGELFDRYSRLVFSLARHATGDPTSAEEITQDVFVHAWERAGQYRPDQGTVRTWLASIARHRSIDHLRRLGARAEGQSVSWDEIEDGPGMEVRIGSTQPEAELSMMRAEVRAAVGQLPEDQKQALALAYFRGYTQGEIEIAFSHRAAGRVFLSQRTVKETGFMGSSHAYHSDLPEGACLRGGPATGYSTITLSLLLRPKTSGEYISSALAGGTTKVPGVVARAT